MSCPIENRICVKRGYGEALSDGVESVQKRPRIERAKRAIGEVGTVEGQLSRKRPRLVGSFSEQSASPSQDVDMLRYAGIFHAHVRRGHDAIPISSVPISRVVRDLVSGAKRAHRFFKGCQKTVVFIRSLTFGKR